MEPIPDAAARRRTLGIGLAIQPTLERIERSELTAFFLVVFGAAATALLVVLLVKLGVPIQGSLVLTGSLLRFLPGAALVSGMHDLIDGALVSGAARLAEVALLGVAIAGAASLVLAFGASLDVQLQVPPPTAPTPSATARVDPGPPPIRGLLLLPPKVSILGRPGPPGFDDGSGRSDRRRKGGMACASGGSAPPWWWRRSRH